MSHHRENVLVGRKANGEKVYVTARFDHPRGKLWKTTVNHEPTTERLRLSLQGVVISKYGNLENDRSWISCGQVTDELAALTNLEPGWTVADVAKLIEIWEHWHLNDMRAGCVHQVNGQNSPNCPETGYKYGSDWLIASLPYKVFAWISERFEIEPPTPGTDTL